MTDDQLLADLTATKKALLTRGHCTGYLIVDNGTRNGGECCMVGAAGAAVEGSRFVDAVLRHRTEGYAEDFDWSERGRAVLEAIERHRPGREGWMSRLAQWVTNIGHTNDGEVRTLDRALRWLDKAICEVREQLASQPPLAPAVAEPETSTLAALGLETPKAAEVPYFA